MIQPGVGQSSLRPGQMVRVNQQHVQVERYLSQGGYALVYIVTTQEPINGCTRHVLKRIIAPDEIGLADVQNEVQVMRRLQGHPNIVHLIDSSWQRLSDYTFEILILMELCPGGGIIDMMNRRLRERLSEAEILQVFVDVCEALAFMHSRKPPILHRDLKVENILQSTSNSYKLCDFGSASGRTAAPHTELELRSLENDLNKHTTLQYRAPEMVDLFLRRRIDEKSDIWALGVLLYKLCYYTTPFEEHGPIAILTVQYKIPTYPVYSQGLVGLIASMLREHGVHRPTIFSVLQSVHSFRGTNSRADYSGGQEGDFVPFATPAQAQARGQNKLIRLDKTTALDISKTGRTPFTQSTRGSPMENYNNFNTEPSILGPIATDNVALRAGQHDKQSTPSADHQTFSSIDRQSTTHLTDSFGISFGAIRPSSNACISVPSPSASSRDHINASFSSSLLKGGKTGSAGYDAFKGLDGLSIKSLSITGPGRSLPAAPPSNTAVPSLKPPTPYRRSYAPGSPKSLKSFSPQPRIEGLPAELRYPSVDDIDTLASPSSPSTPKLAVLASTNRVNTPAKLSATKPTSVSSPQVPNSRSQQVTGSAMKVPTPQFSASSAQELSFVSLEQNSSARIPVVEPSKTPRLLDAASPSIVTATPKAILTEGGFITSTKARLPNTSHTSSPQASRIDASEKPFIVAGSSTFLTHRSSRQAKEESSSDDEGPENPLQQYHSEHRTNTSSPTPKRNRKSSVHNLVDFYEAGSNNAAKIIFTARLPQATSIAEPVLKVAKENHKTESVDHDYTPTTPKIRTKRPQSVLITSSSFRSGDISWLPQKAVSGEVTSPPLKRAVSPPVGSATGRQSKEVSMPSDLPPDRDADSKQKPPPARSLVALIEADSSSTQVKSPTPRGEPSPERSFRGVGDLIQRWQTMSQSK